LYEAAVITPHLMFLEIFNALGYAKDVRREVVAVAESDKYDSVKKPLCVRK
jgi:hypothetical protein